MRTEWLTTAVKLCSCRLYLRLSQQNCDNIENVTIDGVCPASSHQYSSDAELLRSMRKLRLDGREQWARNTVRPKTNVQLLARSLTAHGLWFMRSADSLQKASAACINFALTRAMVGINVRQRNDTDRETSATVAISLQMRYQMSIVEHDLFGWSVLLCASFGVLCLVERVVAVWMVLL